MVATSHPEPHLSLASLVLRPRLCSSVTSACFHTRPKPANAQGASCNSPHRHLTLAYMQVADLLPSFCARNPWSPPSRRARSARSPPHPTRITPARVTRALPNATRETGTARSSPGALGQRTVRTLRRAPSGPRARAPASSSIARAAWASPWPSIFSAEEGAPHRPVQRAPASSWRAVDSGCPGWLARGCPVGRRELVGISVGLVIKAGDIGERRARRGARIAGLERRRGVGCCFGG